MAGSSPTSDEISKLAIPLLFGTLGSWMLYGVLLVQTYIYAYNFPNDRLMTKFVVYFLLAMETTQTALTGADVYYWFIGGFGDFERFRDSHYGPIDMPFMTGVSSIMVQMYFCNRIWTLTRNLWLCTAIVVLSMVSVAGGIWGGSASLRVGKFAVPKVARTSVYLCATSALADTMITIAMTLLLRRASEGSCRFVRVVRLAIETNALSASMVITTFVLYIAFPNESYCILPAAITGKLYSNTLLVSLNNRIYFRDHSTRSSGGGGTGHFTVASRARTTGISSIDFSSARARLQSPVELEVFQLESSHTRNLENDEDDSASINSDPSHAPGDAIRMKTGPSIAQSSASAHGGE